MSYISNFKNVSMGLALNHFNFYVAIMPFARVLYIFLIFCFSAAAVQAKTYKVCQSAEPCIDIMKRHAPNSFDYDVLASEFTRLDNKGRAALLAETQGEHASSAIELLSRTNFEWSAQDQTYVLSLWPQRSDEALLKLYRKLNPAAVRDRAIGQLNHPSEKIRLQARELLKGSEISAGTPAQLPSLISASRKAPTPEIVAILNSYDNPAVEPALRDVLKSGHEDSMLAAYDLLVTDRYKFTPRDLNFIVSNLRGDQYDTALALASILRRQAVVKNDKDALKFAALLSASPNVTSMGRFVGFNVLADSSAIKSKPALPVSPYQLESFKAGLKKPSAYTNYLNNLVYLTQAMNTDEALKAFWESLKDQTGLERLHFLTQLSAYPSPVVADIAKEAAANNRDYKVMMTGLSILAMQKDPSVRERLTQMANVHPVTDAQRIARGALKFYNSDAQPKDIARLLNDRRGNQPLNKAAEYCSGYWTDFRDKARSMPYYDFGVFEDGASAERRYLRTATPTQGGWLAGYQTADDKGEVLFYNDTVNRTEVLFAGEAPLAILPKNLPAVGQYPSDFWVIAGDKLYSLNSSGSKLSAVLPSPAIQVVQGKDSSIAIDFVPPGETSYDYNPPLQLLPKGGMLRACR